MKQILITGSKGQLGSELMALAEQFAHWQFIPTDVDTLDLTDKRALSQFLAEHKVDYVVNCAAYTAVDKAEDDLDLCYKINRDAVRNLGEAAHAHQARVVHISTDYVFDGQANTPYKETDAVNPQSVYGKSKLAGEQALQASGAESIIIRTAWLYSTYGNNFVKTMRRLAAERDELNVVCDQTGTPTYAADLAQAIVAMIAFAEKEQQFPTGIYHYSNEGVTTWHEFATEIIKLAGHSCTVKPIPTSQYPTKVARPMYSVLDKSKLRSTFKLTVPNWEESLRICSEKLIIHNS
ncbi:dTDP-4-dehydrorhamnose reductase [Candidatus Symbiothrix dinenymphae]|uniref:dTDP-4-dehydrorhamnose reductase n=1 Tax=Candidatus Symbiothrix dinenymphae TaxID=467085 RepID=UPI000703292E|nr:dTDP-4-dehydrorhamnose reductase [Candidatus Symbiothrix dinenymphae]